MSADIFTNSLLAIWSVIYLGIAYFIIRRRGLHETAIRYLVIYALVGFVVDFLTSLIYQGWPLLAGTIDWLPFYGSALLLWLFLALSDDFLNRQQFSLWLGFGGMWLGMLLMLWIIGGSSDSILGGNPNWYTILFWMTVLTCAFFTIRIAFITLVAFHQSRQPLYKNRIIYWALALAFMVLGIILIFANIAWAGAALRLGGLLIATYTIWSYRQVNVFEVGLRVASFLTLTLLGIAVYSLSFYAVQWIVGDTEGYNSFIIGMAIAIALVMLANPVANMVWQWIHKLVFGVEYDPGQVVRDYSQGINNIVDIQRLTKTSLELIAGTFELKHGIFFLVDSERDENQKRLYYWLRPVAQLEGRERSTGRINANSPLVTQICQEQQPIMQYDIDVMPKYEGMAEEELHWLEDLGTDIYLPICTDERWLGLLALGRKPTDGQYSGQDTLLLTTLIEQTIVALENARLFADLEEANTNLHNAYMQLERANQDLREIDELKSSFIGVVSHEMRTPLANVGFALQIFERQGMEQLQDEQRQQFTALKNSVQLTSLMIENLIMLASFLNNQVILQLEEIKPQQLLNALIDPLKASARQKGIQLQLDIVGELPLVLADRKLLTNAVYQLVHNAIKFTEKNGNVWLSCWATSQHICIDVKDNGRGVPADRMTEMWKEFTQMVDPLKRGLEGLGLGLALVRHIVAAHGGEVWADSDEGQGSDFGFQIPIAGPQQATSPKDVLRKRVVRRG